MSTDPYDDVGAAIRNAAAEISAPADLRRRLAEQQEHAEDRRRRRGRRSLFALGGTAAAALVAALVIAIGGLNSDPSAADAAALALQAPTATAQVAPTDPSYLVGAVDGVRFPNFGYGAAWPAVGVRSGRVGDRRTLVVTYARGAQRVGYAIVAGDPLPSPDGTHSATPRGTPVVVSRHDGATAVTWERGGHTCVLVSRTVPAAQLLALIDWKA